MQEFLYCGLFFSFVDIPLEEVIRLFSLLFCSWKTKHSNSNTSYIPLINVIEVPEKRKLLVFLRSYSYFLGDLVPYLIPFFFLVLFFFSSSLFCFFFCLFTAHTECGIYSDYEKFVGVFLDVFFPLI